MYRSKGFTRVNSIMLSVLLAVACLGISGLAFATEDAGAGQSSAASLSAPQPESTGEQKAAPSDSEQPAVAKPQRGAATAEPQQEAAVANPQQDEAIAIQQQPAAANAQQGSASTDAKDPGAAESDEQASEAEAPKPTPKLLAARAITETDLSGFLTKVDIDAPTDGDGNYVINPNGTYEVTFVFNESENLQFNDEATLTYALPKGLLVSNVASTAFPIKITDEHGIEIVEGNTVEVADGQLRVVFNQSDPNFERLKAMPNVNFDLSIASRIDQTYGEISFNANIVKDFVFEEKSDLTIDKSVSYNMETDTANYVLTIRSEGPNQNVVIEDRLIGTALIFNQDVVVESSVHGPLAITPDYTAVENGFRVSIPQTADGEVLTLRYSATVDNTKISSNGTVEQTRNTARVTSEQVPDGKEASADFAGQAKFQRIEKEAVGNPKQIGENLYEQTWKIRINEDHRLPMGGTHIYDWITQGSRPFMSFNGDGLKIEVTLENGNKETRQIPWSDLILSQTNDRIWGWDYLTPETDGKASYEIICTTLIDSSAALGDLTLVNGAQVHNSYDEGTTTVGTTEASTFNIKKEASGTTSTESEWAVTVTVPGSGLADLRVTDDAPKLTHEGQEYIDYFDEDSFVVEGLLDGESWNLYISQSNQRSYTLTFYQSATQSDANKGVLPTPNGQPRDIVIRFKTKVNQDWLNLASEDGYSSTTLARHRNYAAAWSGAYRTPSVHDTVVPIKQQLVKNFVERAEVEIDGITYPVFRYSLSLHGPVEDGAVIQDAFNTEYLKLYEAEGVTISGGTGTTATDSNGTASAANTATGADITVSSFPKQGDGAFYPYYELSYALIVKDQAALEALNAAAAQSQGGIDLENTATWNDLTSSRSVNYTYFPYVDKELLTRPSSDNGYVAEFKVILNKYAEDLDPASDTLVVQDVLSSNLRFIPDSLTISPANDAITVRHDTETNTLTFEGVPDQTTFEVTYQARVLGSGNVTYSNTVKFGNFERTVEEEAVVESSGTGSGSNPSITLVKRDAEDINRVLAGATFQLFYLDDAGNQVAVQDRDGADVTFTTGADGAALIVGNLQNLGWTLWTGRTYCLVETEAPFGYEVNAEPTYFVLTETPSSQTEYDVTGNQLSVQNNLVKISIPVTKTWDDADNKDGSRPESITVRLLADGVEVDSKTISAEDEWTWTFEGLAKFDPQDGHEIAYDISEDPVEGYETSYNGYDITNKRETEPPTPPTPEDPDEPTPPTPEEPEEPSTPNTPSEKPGKPNTPSVDKPNKTNTPNTPTVPNKSTIPKLGDNAFLLTCALVAILVAGVVLAIAAGIALGRRAAGGRPQKDEVIFDNEDDEDDAL